jgi:outer membrane protein assembly factor BamB
MILARVLVGCGWLAAAGPGQEWTRFRGPNGSGIAAGSGSAILPAEDNLAWRAEVGAGASSPVLGGGNIYVTAARDGKLWTVCVDARDGRVKWRKEAPRPRREKVDARNSAAAPTPAAGAFGVVVFFPDYGLLAYDPRGKEMWRTALGPFNNVYGMGASPLVVDERVVLVVDQGVGSYIAAFGLRDGRQRWRTERKEALSGHSTPIVYTPAQGAKQVLAPGSFRVDAYDVESGESRWHVRGLPAEMKSTPVLFGARGDERLLVSGYNSPENEPGKQVAIAEFDAVRVQADADGDGKVSKREAPDERVRTYFRFLDLDGDGALDAEEWRIYRATMTAENGLLVLRAGGSGDRTGAALEWSWRRGVAQCPSPLVYGGRVYMLGDNGVLTILDAATGKLVEQGRVRGQAEPYFASPVAAAGHVYLVSQRGVVTVLKAGGGLEPVHVRDLGEEILATPALGDGMLLVRAGGGLTCYRPRL